MVGIPAQGGDILLLAVFVPDNQGAVADGGMGGALGVAFPVSAAQGIGRHITE
ncbi:hypothetical protein Phpb_01198 [Photorhabdus namnaonensis]|uniref:Uncharacterized protein n=1 Tax=Photorhabdus namnaonensis TaxID=1851568 RepID=A0A1B8YKN6_9GAMM|nr:hypothetical protein Phpb_01198 [Photorhabdus namnaonensis]